MNIRCAAIVLTLTLASVMSAMAQIGAGNGNAIALAKKSPAVQTAYNYLISQAQREVHRRDGSLVNVLRFKNQHVRQLRFVQVGNQRQVTLMARLLRGDMNLFLNRYRLVRMPRPSAL